MAMGSPGSRGNGQLLLVLLLLLDLYAVQSLDVSPPTSAPAPAPAPAAVASPFSFSFNFANASSYRTEDLKFESSASPATAQDDHVDVTCNSYRKDPTHCTGRVSYAHPVPFYDNTTGELASFHTRFTFDIIYNNTKKGDGMAFFLAFYPSNLSSNSRGGHLGLLNPGDDGKTHHTAFGDERFVAVEFDTFKNPWDRDLGDHIGIDINSVTSVNTTLLRSSSLKDA